MRQDPLHGLLRDVADRPVVAVDVDHGQASDLLDSSSLVDTQLHGRVDEDPVKLATA